MQTQVKGKNSPGLWLERREYSGAVAVEGGWELECNETLKGEASLLGPLVATSSQTFPSRVV